MLNFYLIFFRLPVLAGAAGPYCSPYIAVDGSYHARPAGQSSSGGTSRLVTLNLSGFAVKFIKKKIVIIINYYYFFFNAATFAFCFPLLVNFIISCILSS